MKKVCLFGIIAGLFLSVAFAGFAHAQVKIGVQQAVAMARKTVKDSSWQIAFVSNTGVTQSYTTERIRTPQGAMMNKDGKAGQWVVEFYKNSPKKISEGSRQGFAYPFMAVLVTGQSAEAMPDAELAVPKALKPLKADAIGNLERAYGAAVSRMKGKFDVATVGSDVRADGSCSWRFRFYDLKKQNIVDKANISCDGKTPLSW